MHNQLPYSQTRLDERGIRFRARQIASTLHARGEQPRAGEGGAHRFWILGARCTSGVFVAYQPGARVYTSGSMQGELYLLLDSGELASGDWREEPFGSVWAVSNVSPMTATEMAGLDFIDTGGWRKERVHDRTEEQLRREYYPRLELKAKRAGYGLRLALTRLQEDGLRHQGYATGMRYPPRSPI